VRRVSCDSFAVISSAVFADHIPIDVALHISGRALAPVESEITFSITLTAVFPRAAYAVTDSLPPNTRFVHAQGTPWNCLESKGKITCGNERLDSATTSIRHHDPRS